MGIHRAMYVGKAKAQWQCIEVTSINREIKLIMSFLRDIIIQKKIRRYKCKS